MNKRKKRFDMYTLLYTNHAENEPKVRANSNFNMRLHAINRFNAFEHLMKRVQQKMNLHLVIILWLNFDVKNG